MREIIKNNLETGRLQYKNEELLIDVEKGEHCDHYDVIMISSQGMLFGLHIETIEALYALPFRWEDFAHIKNPEGEIVALVSLD